MPIPPKLTSTKKDIEMITYGYTGFELCRFREIRNGMNYVKPHGGLWSSPVESNWGWKDWCKAEEFNLPYLQSHFKFKYYGNILTIDSLDDLKVILYHQHDGKDKIDFEFLMEKRVGAIHLTERGQHATHLSTPGLYGWDCESVLVMNPNYIIQTSSYLKDGTLPPVRREKE